MTFKRKLRYCWLKFKRLQGSPQKLAWGMALGVFIGVTPTVPFHTVAVLSLAPLLRVSPVTAYLGIWIMNPVTIAPIYYVSYEVGRLLLFKGNHLALPATFDLNSVLDLLWRGGLALQVGGVLVALPPTILSYFLTLWAVNRYRQARARELGSVPPFTQNRPTTPGPEA